MSIRANIQWLQERLNPEILSTDSNHMKRDQRVDAIQEEDHHSIQDILQLMERGRQLMKYEKENIEKDYNLALSSFIYHRCLLRDSLAIVLIDSFVMSFSLIVSNAILFWINGITFSIVNGWLDSGLIVYASSKLLLLVLEPLMS